jgi:hypothetical protein
LSTFSLHLALDELGSSHCENHPVKKVIITVETSQQSIWPSHLCFISSGSAQRSIRIIKLSETYIWNVNTFRKCNCSFQFTSIPGTDSINVRRICVFYAATTTTTLKPNCINSSSFHIISTYFKIILNLRSIFPSMMINQTHCLKIQLLKL